MVRLKLEGLFVSKIGGSGPFSVIVQGEAVEHPLKVIVFVPPAAMAASISKRRSPDTPVLNRMLEAGSPNSVRLLYNAA